MNKRMKKKHRLTHLLIVLQARRGLLEREKSICQSELATCKRRISELEGIVSQHAQATNNRFDELETYQKILEDNLKVLEKKQSKKSWFGRR